MILRASYFAGPIILMGFHGKSFSLVPTLVIEGRPYPTFMDSLAGHRIPEGFWGFMGLKL